MKFSTWRIAVGLHCLHAEQEVMWFCIWKCNVLRKHSVLEWLHRERECQVLLSYDHDYHDEVFVERCSVARRNSLTMILTWCWWTEITIVTLVTLVTVSVVAEGSDWQSLTTVDNCWASLQQFTPVSDSVNCPPEEAIIIQQITALIAWLFSLFVANIKRIYEAEPLVKEATQSL